jgi:site-specific DNA-cytosine methylase
MSKVIEFCCGYGGASEGILRSGLEIEKSFDIWQIAVDAHSRWHTQTPCETRDVKTIEPEECQGRIVWASLPCQPWSSANRTASRGKAHSSYYSLAHFARQVQFAEFAVLENVPGLAQEKDGKAELEELRSECKKLGLSCDINILPSWWFGVMQQRKRVIITINAPWVMWQAPSQAPHEFEPSPTASEGKGGRILPDGTHDSGAKRKARRLEAAVRATSISGSDSPEYRKLANTVLANRDQGRGRTDKWSGEKNTESESGEINFKGRSVEECAALQGLPIEHIKDLPKTHQYTLIGNAVPPSVAHGVMANILRYA